MQTSRGIVHWALAAAAVSAGCRGHDAPPTARFPEPPPRSVRTVSVERIGAAGEWAPGVVLARQHATLASRLQATVVALPFREGDRVAAGAVAARLDAAASEAAVAAAAAVDQAAGADQRRVDALLASGAATPREAEDATARAAAARAALQAARDDLSYAVLRAPFAGRVASRPVHVGDVVAPGAPVIEIEGDAGWEIQATVDGRAATQIRPGVALTVAVDGQAEPFTAVVRAVSPAGDAATHRFEVRADLPAAPGQRSGSFARLLLPASAGESRLVVPGTAVVRRGGLTGVFVVAGGRSRLRWVALGAADGDRIEVRAGVDAGEKVAVDPAGLAEAMTVREEG